MPATGHPAPLHHPGFPEGAQPSHEGSCSRGEAPCPRPLVIPTWWVVVAVVSLECQPSWSQLQLTLEEKPQGP